MDFYVTTAYLKKNSLIHGNVNEEKLVVILRKVQSIRFKNILGSTLQKDLLAKVAAKTITGNDKILVDDYIVPALLSWCEVTAAKYYNIEIRNKNVGKSSDQYQNANPDKENYTFISELKKDATSLTNDLITYLKCNSDLFPAYCDTSEDGATPPDSVGDSYKDTIIFI